MRTGGPRDNVRPGVLRPRGALWVTWVPEGTGNPPLALMVQYRLIVHDASELLCSQGRFPLFGWIHDREEIGCGQARPLQDNRAGRMCVVDRGALAYRFRRPRPHA